MKFPGPGSSPRNVQVRPLSSSTMVIQWDEPEEQNGVVTGYKVSSVIRFKGEKMSNNKGWAKSIMFSFPHILSLMPYICKLLVSTPHNQHKNF